jgi:proline dehydrogenase
VKLIRGAYMNEERYLARQGGYESPVHETIENTHKCYNTNLRLLTSVLRPKDRLFIGSHNLESVDIARKLIKEHNLVEGRVTFGQLKGFSD